MYAKFKPFILWLLATVSAALIGVLLNWIENPFKTIEDSRIMSSFEEIKDTRVFLFYSKESQGLASAIEYKFQTHGVFVNVGDNNFKTEKSNIRYYREKDLSRAKAVQNILNKIAGENPSLKVRFVINSRIDARHAERDNVIHVYF